MSCCGLRFHRGLYGAQLPAREGVSNVFQAAKQCGVGKIVLTSSVAAVTDSPVNGHVYTEEDWNTASTEDRNPYYYSKTVAEKRGWELASELGIELVVINVRARRVALCEVMPYDVQWDVLLPCECSRSDQAPAVHGDRAIAQPEPQPVQSNLLHDFEWRMARDPANRCVTWARRSQVWWSSISLTLLSMGHGGCERCCTITRVGTGERCS